VSLSRRATYKKTGRAPSNLGAKAVNAQADIAMPVRNEGGEIVAVVGAAFAGERDIQGAELDRLQPAAASLMERL